MNHAGAYAQFTSTVTTLQYQNRMATIYYYYCRYVADELTLLLSLNLLLLLYRYVADEEMAARLADANPEASHRSEILDPRS